MKFQIFVALFFLMLNRIVTADERLIPATCNQTSYKDLCTSVLMSDRRSVNTTTAGLALILMDRFIEKTKLAMKIVSEGTKTTKDPQVVHALKRCGEMYHALLVKDVPMTIKALTKGNSKSAEKGARDAAGEAKSCEDGFPFGTSPVSGLNKDIGMLAEVAASIGRRLK